MASQEAVASRQTQVGEQMTALDAAVDTLEKEVGMLEERLTSVSCEASSDKNETPPTPLVVVCGHAANIRAEVSRIDAAWKRLGDLRRRLEI
jgi:hypothetical protein